LHAGLICLNGPNGMDLDMQLEAFSVLLDVLETDSPEPDLTNQVLEATIESEAAPDVIVRRYDLPVADGTVAQDAAVQRRRPKTQTGGTPTPCRRRL
jgi:hypothetical protein